MRQKLELILKVFIFPKNLKVEAELLFFALSVKLILRFKISVACGNNLNLSHTYSVPFVEHSYLRSARFLYLK